MNFQTQVPAGYAMSQDKQAGHRTALVHASNTFDSTIALAQRVCALADRLCGNQLSEATSGSVPAMPGIFGAIEATCSNVDRELAAANADLDRVEAELAAS